LAKVTRIGEFGSIELRFDMFNVTREILHNPVFHTQVAGANALNATVIPGTTIPIMGSIPPRNIYFLPHTIQVGAQTYLLGLFMLNTMASVARKICRSPLYQKIIRYFV
jgi:hypothetical protein